MKTGLLLLLFLTTLAPAQLPGLRKHTFKQGQYQRNYLVYTPKGAAKLPGKRPVVFVIHGGGGKAQGMARSHRKTYHSLADRDGFYLVYPDSLDGMWDFGAGKVSQELKRRVDDKAYFQKILTELPGKIPVDPKRLYATGISRGGQCCYFLAREFPGRFRAIAPITMPVPAFMADGLDTGKPLPILLINGTDDPLVPYDGGQINVLRKQRGVVLSTDATLALFRKRNGCSAKPVAQDRIDRADDGCAVRRTFWKGKAPVVLYRIEGGGHTWPGGQQYLGERLIGKVCRDIDGAAETWTFFKQLE